MKVETTSNTAYANHCAITAPCSLNGALRWVVLGQSEQIIEIHFWL